MPAGQQELILCANPAAKLRVGLDGTIARASAARGPQSTLDSHACRLRPLVSSAEVRLRGPAPPPFEADFPVPDLSRYYRVYPKREGVWGRDEAAGELAQEL